MMLIPMNVVQSTTPTNHSDDLAGGVLLVALAALCVASLALWVAALVSILRSTYDTPLKMVGILGVLVLPMAGPLAWFGIVKKRQPAIGAVGPAGSAGAPRR